MNNYKQLPKTINRINHFTVIRMILNKLFRKQGNAGKVGRALTGQIGHSPKKFWERFLNFLEKNIILLVGIFLGSIIILNIFLTLILVIKYL
jgi:hypothetical protein